jgi:anti-sigma B factor antagonist
MTPQGRDTALTLVRPEVMTDYLCGKCGALGSAPTHRDDCEDRVSVVPAPRELDIYTAGLFREHLCAISRVYSQIVIDLTCVRHMDMTGLGVLVGAQKRARAQGGAIAVACHCAVLTRIFDTTGLAGVLRVCGTVDEAVAALSEVTS